MNHLKSFRLRTVLFGFYDICSRGVGLEWWRQLEQAVLGCFRKVLKSITGPIYISCVRNMSTFAGVIGGLKPSINEPSCKHSNRNCHVRCLLHETRTFHSDQQERVRWNMKVGSYVKVVRNWHGQMITLKTSFPCMGCVLYAWLGTFVKLDNLK